MSRPSPVTSRTMSARGVGASSVWCSVSNMCSILAGVGGWGNGGSGGDGDGVRMYAGIGGNGGTPRSLNAHHVESGRDVRPLRGELWPDFGGVQMGGWVLPHRSPGVPDHVRKTMGAGSISRASGLALERGGAGFFASLKNDRGARGEGDGHPGGLFSAG